MKEVFKKNKGCSTNKRVDIIEKVISRIALRAHKTTTAIISPQPIMIYKSDEDVR